ncbi:class I SAM-dependent methyltransferase [Candidatus Pelagibacter communis]|uniref:class I SAM-dependent methyltransferase n=1 Tax=Pelagibacter ubique TaxID=198252 RepID=UPI00094CB8AA|nr:class I SAM-dependent methyltransferase [Candidatus Pelagibacter ubique]
MNKFFLNLGNQPLANNYLNSLKKKHIKYTLRLFFNTNNKIVSISKRIPSEKMFTNDYPYRSSMSKTMRHSFYELSKEIKKRFNPDKLLEIGSNDGALIKNFKMNKVIGVEPCKNLANITSKKGFLTYNKYWNYKLAKKIKDKHGNIDLIYSANTLTHISNLDDVFRSISLLLKDKGVLIIEDPSLLECIKKNSYDQFYNEHIYLFSAISVKNIISKYDLEIFDIKNLLTHGGSLRYYIKKKINKSFKISIKVKKQIDKEKKYEIDKFKTYKNFSKKVKKSKENLLKILNNIKKNNKKIIGYGATAKAVTVINYCDIDKNLISNFVDTTPEKINNYMPGKNIKILRYNKNILKNYDYAFLGAWNFKNEIINKEKKYFKKGLKFLTHIPKPQVLKYKKK